MILYLDTSALVKLYVQEEGSAAVREEVSRAVAVATSRIAYAEARTAFARRAREGALSPEDLRRVVTAFNADWETVLCVELTEGISRQAGESERQSLKKPRDQKDGNRRLIHHDEFTAEGLGKGHEP